MSNKLSFIEFLLSQNEVKQYGGGQETIVGAPKSFDDFYQTIKMEYGDLPRDEVDSNKIKDLSNVNILLYVFSMQSGIQDNLKDKINELIALHNIRLPEIHITNTNKKDILDGLIGKLMEL